MFVAGNYGVKFDDTYCKSLKVLVVDDRLCLRLCARRNRKVVLNDTLRMIAHVQICKCRLCMSCFVFVIAIFVFFGLCFELHSFVDIDTS